MKLFRFRGITVELHPAFYLLPLLAGIEGWIDTPDDRWAGLAVAVGAVALVYTCVVLHEFGHALTARHLGVPVRRIVLLPFGGMALMGYIPRNPLKELLIIVAGPAVNFVIADICLLLLGNSWSNAFNDYAQTTPYQDILGFLFIANATLGTFNLLPAFPMDGGRILRALLTLKFDYLRATRWAMYVGRCVAVAGIVVALYKEAFLLAALFVFILWIGKREYEFLLYEEMTANTETWT